VIDGVHNNRQFCMNILRNNEYIKGTFNTGFIPRHIDTLLGYDSYE
jgi:acetyl/propionyl-CoA carboxylase alpha subunit